MSIKSFSAERGDAKMVEKSRNTLLASAFVFLGIVLLLRLSGGFFEDNAVRVVGAIFGGSAEKVPLIEFDGISLASLGIDFGAWSLGDFTSGINAWTHEMVDTVMPAVIYSFNAMMIHAIAMMRVEVLTASVKLSKVTWFFYGFR